MSDQRLSAEQWARFWRNGDVTTFRGRFRHNYDGPVLEFWRRVFDETPTGARIVDMATGNGALALLCAQYAEANGRDFEITAFDFADIDPARDVADPALLAAAGRIDFRGRTRIEATGFGDDAFDLAVSQFGFEYAEADAGLREVDRIVAAADARIALMLHHADSAIIAQARDGLDQVGLCEQSGVPGIVNDLLNRLERLARKGRKPADDEHAEMLRGELNQRLAALDGQSRKFRDPSQIAFFINNIMSVFNPKLSGDLDTAGKKGRVTEVLRETRAYRARMTDLVASARSRDDIAALETGLKSHGFRIDDSGYFQFEGVPFSYTLKASR